MYDDFRSPRPPQGLSNPDGPEYRPERNWSEVWITAVTSPNLETYQDLIRDQNIDLSRSVIWVYLVSIATSILAGLSQIIFGGFNQSLNASLNNTNSSASTADPAGFGMIQIICSPLLALIAVAFWLLLVAIYHFVAGSLLGGTGKFDELAFALAAYQAPLNLAMAALSFIPLVGSCLALPLLVYQMFLAVVSINAVHDFGWGKAVLTYFLPLILLVICLVSCIVVFIIALAGASTSP
jgi:hypothetical protein